MRPPTVAPVAGDRNTWPVLVLRTLAGAARRALWGAALAGVLALPSIAGAQTEAPRPPRHRHTLTGFAYRAQSQALDLTAVGGIFDFTFVPEGLPWLFFGSSQGFVWSERFTRYDAWTSGSVGYGGGSAPEVIVGLQTATERDVLRVGLGFHPGFPAVEHDHWVAEAYRLFAVPYGGSRTWLWRPDAMTLHLDLSVETFVRSGPWLEASTSLAVLFITVGDGVELFGEGSIGGGHWLGPVLLGARARAVVGAPGTIAYRSGTTAQVSVEPLARLWWDVLEIELAVNVTIAGATPGWDTLGAWGVRLSAGDRF